MRNFLRISLAIITLIVAGSCSTKKNTVVTRGYHNLTSHYNIYFNAYDSYIQGIKKVETSFRDDFNTLLPLFLYQPKDAASMILTDMDKTVRKCSKVVAMHSITARPKMKRGARSARQKEFYRKKEYVKWVDDAFLLMGKGYFQKRDYFPAIENFEYVIKEYPAGGLADQASLWLARTHIELKNYTESQEILNRLIGNPNLEKKLRPEVNAVYADWFIRQDDYESAVTYLSRAVDKYPGKKQLTRNLYVLGQLYEKTENPENAIRYYELVNKGNPAYDMDFNARINRARLYQGGEAGGEKIRKELRKMLRDEKNYDFQDQIYYALADLDMKEGKTDEAVINYKKSAWTNTNNATQKALSYLALGKYYYAKPEYIPAGAYYDSASQNLPETYPDYEKIITFSADVKLLSDNLLIVFREDSLQQVAKLPESERNKLIGEKIAAAVKIEEEIKALEEEDRLAMQQGRMRSGMNVMNQGMRGSMQSGGLPGSQMGNRSNMGISPGFSESTFGAMDMDFSTGSGSGGWYFYNPSTLSFGMSEFIKIWGRRKLEDNWRRSNKKILTEADDLSDEGETGDVSTPVSTSKANQFKPTQREYYTADLPLNDTLIGESNQRISQALFNAAKVFKENLNNNNEAVQYFERFNNRFPEDEKLLFSYYNLYQIYEMLKVPAEMQRYKDLILQKFPDSRSAKIISNPNYFKELDEARVQVLTFYEETYRLFEGNSWETVIRNCEKAETAFALNPIRDKFGYLKVISSARLSPSDTVALVKGLNDLVFKYPSSEIAEPAKNLLSLISRGPTSTFDKLDGLLPVGQAGLAAGEEEIEYFTDDASTHFYILIVSGNNVDVGKLKFRISNFNVEKYTEDFFEVASSVFEEDLQIITVKNFTNKRDALAYYETISLDPDVFEGMIETDYRHFVITKDNFTRFYKDKNVFEYIKFFRDNYLN